MNEKERIIQIMNEENMNASQFSEMIGIQRAAISHILAGRNNPSLDVIKKILKSFSTINPDWLLSGEGPMRRSSQKAFDNTNHSAATNVDVSKYDLFSQPDPRQSSVPERLIGNQTTTNINADIKIPAQDNGIYPSNNRTEIHFTDEKTQGEEVNSTANEVKEIVKESIIYKERSNKTIDKLLIFYSDNTFETFIPEKKDK